MLSVVIPVYDEATSLAPLYTQLDEVTRAHDLHVEWIFVDDGSRDTSWQVISELAGKDSRVHGIRFRRNFGKAAALNAGFAAATGQRIITLDADLQDDPAEIPKLLAEMDKGFELVSGWKRIRHDPWHKTLPSRVFNWMVSTLTRVQLHDHNCGLKCYDRDVVREIRLYGELHRFTPVLAAARGFRVGEVVVTHRPRQFGRSKYGVNRIVKGFLDLLTVKFLTGFGQRPQHLIGTFGLASFALGLLGMFYLAVYWLLSRTLESIDVIHLHQRAALYYSLGLLLMGGQLLSVGFLAEMITAYASREADGYSISERTARHETQDKGSEPMPSCP